MGRFGSVAFVFSLEGDSSTQGKAQQSHFCGSSSSTPALPVADHPITTLEQASEKVTQTSPNIDDSFRGPFASADKEERRQWTWTTPASGLEGGRTPGAMSFTPSDTSPLPFSASKTHQPESTFITIPPEIKKGHERSSGSTRVPSVVADEQTRSSVFSSRASDYALQTKRRSTSVALRDSCGAESRRGGSEGAAWCSAPKHGPSVSSAEGHDGRYAGERHVRDQASVDLSLRVDSLEDEVAALRDQTLYSASFLAPEREKLHDGRFIASTRLLRPSIGERSQDGVQGEYFDAPRCALSPKRRARSYETKKWDDAGFPEHSIRMTSAERMGDNGCHAPLRCVQAPIGAQGLADDARAGISMRHTRSADHSAEKLHDKSWYEKSISMPCATPPPAELLHRRVVQHTSVRVPSVPSQGPLLDGTRNVTSTRQLPNSQSRSRDHIHTNPAQTRLSRPPDATRQMSFSSYQASVTPWETHEANYDASLAASMLDVPPRTRSTKQYATHPSGVRATRSTEPHTAQPTNVRGTRTTATQRQTRATDLQVPYGSTRSSPSTQPAQIPREVPARGKRRSQLSKEFPATGPLFSCASVEQRKQANSKFPSRRSTGGSIPDPGPYIFPDMEDVASTHPRASSLEDKGEEHQSCTMSVVSFADGQPSTSTRVSDHNAGHVAPRRIEASQQNAATHRISLPKRKTKHSALSIPPKRLSRTQTMPLLLRESNEMQDAHSISAEEEHPPPKFKRSKENEEKEQSWRTMLVSPPQHETPPLRQLAGSQPRNSRATKSAVSETLDKQPTGPQISRKSGSKKSPSQPVSHDLEQGNAIANWWRRLGESEQLESEDKDRILKCLETIQHSLLQAHEMGDRRHEKFEARLSLQEEKQSNMEKELTVAIQRSSIDIGTLISYVKRVSQDHKFMRRAVTDQQAVPITPVNNSPSTGRRPSKGSQKIKQPTDDQKLIALERANSALRNSLRVAEDRLEALEAGNKVSTLSTLNKTAASEKKKAKKRMDARSISSMSSIFFDHSNVNAQSLPHTPDTARGGNGSEFDLAMVEEANSPIKEASIAGASNAGGTSPVPSPDRTSPQTKTLSDPDEQTAMTSDYSSHLRLSSAVSPTDAQVVSSRIKRLEKDDVNIPDLVVQYPASSAVRESVTLSSCSGSALYNDVGFAWQRQHWRDIHSMGSVDIPQSRLRKSIDEETSVAPLGAQLPSTITRPSWHEGHWDKNGIFRRIEPSELTQPQHSGAPRRTLAESDRYEKTRCDDADAHDGAVRSGSLGSDDRCKSERRAYDDKERDEGKQRAYVDKERHKNKRLVYDSEERYESERRAYDDKEHYANERRVYDDEERYDSERRPYDDKKRYANERGAYDCEERYANERSTYDEQRYESERRAYGDEHRDAHPRSADVESDSDGAFSRTRAVGGSTQPFRDVEVLPLEDGGARVDSNIRCRDKCAQRGSHDGDRQRLASFDGDQPQVETIFSNDHNRRDVPTVYVPIDHQASQAYDDAQRDRQVLQPYDDAQHDRQTSRTFDDAQHDCQESLAYDDACDRHASRGYDDAQYDRQASRVYDDAQYDRQALLAYDDAYDRQASRGYDDAQYDRQASRVYDDAQHDRQTSQVYDDAQYDHQASRAYDDAQHDHQAPRAYDDARYDAQVSQAYGDAQRHSNASPTHDHAQFDRQASRTYDDAQYDRQASRAYDDPLYDGQVPQVYDNAQYDSQASRAYDDARYDRQASRGCDDEQHNRQASQAYDDAEHDRQASRAYNDAQHDRSALQTYDDAQYDHQTLVPFDQQPYADCDEPRTEQGAAYADTDHRRSPGTAGAYATESTMRSSLESTESYVPSQMPGAYRMRVEFSSSNSSGDSSDESFAAGRTINEELRELGFSD